MEPNFRLIGMHISLHALISIADALGSTVDWLLRGGQGADVSSHIIGLEQLLEDCTLYERNIKPPSS